MRIDRQEQGYALLAFIITLFLLTIASLGLMGKDVVFDSRNQLIRDETQTLYQIKDRLKLFAQLTPYIYTSTSDTAAGYKGIEQVPGPGYFPCPDFNGDGDSEPNCGNPSPAAFQNRSVTLSTLANSPVPYVGYLPRFVKSRLFQISTSRDKDILYLVDTKFVANNECFINTFPVNIFMDARDYQNAYTYSLSASVTPNPVCAGITALIDIGNRGVAINMNYIKTVAGNPRDANKRLADAFLLSRNLTMNTLLACNTASCVDANGNPNPYLSPAQSFFDPALMPRIKINGRPFYIFALISPGPDHIFQTRVERGTYRSTTATGVVTGDDGTVNVRQGGDDIIVGLHFLEWAKMMQDKLCSDRAYYSDIVQNYTVATNPTQLNRLWLFRHDEDPSTDNYTNKTGTNWVDQLFPVVSQASNLPPFSICDLTIIDQ